MQTVNKQGFLGDVMPATAQNMEKALQDPNVDHIDVFEGTPDKIKERKAMAGKKVFSVHKRFQKTGRNKR